MPVKSRRKAREAALRTLYEMEIGGASLKSCMADTFANVELSEDQEAYARRVIEGWFNYRREVDDLLVPLVKGYDYDRIAAIDRNLLRIGAYELYYEAGIPPAVTLNEMIEIAKKYSTADSGKFVNGVLGRLLHSSPKANWNPENEEQYVEKSEPEPEVEIEPIASEAEFKEIARVGLWKLRTEDNASDDS